MNEVKRLLIGLTSILRGPCGQIMKRTTFFPQKGNLELALSLLSWGFVFASCFGLSWFLVYPCIYLSQGFIAFFVPIFFFLVLLFINIVDHPYVYIIRIVLESLVWFVDNAPLFCGVSCDQLLYLRWIFFVSRHYWVL